MNIKISDLAKIKKGRILVVSGSFFRRRIVDHVLSKNSIRSDSAKDVPSASARLKERDYALVVTDLEIPKLEDGIALLKHIEKNHTRLPVIVATTGDVIQDLVKTPKT